MKNIARILLPTTRNYLCLLPIILPLAQAEKTYHPGRQDIVDEHVASETAAIFANLKKVTTIQ